MAQATLNGQLVDDGGLVCAVWFEWGTTTDYGFETPQQGGFTSGMTFNATLTGLARGVPYHYRAVARNANGTVYGNDVSFATPVDSTIPVLMDDYGLATLLEAL